MKFLKKILAFIPLLILLLAVFLIINISISINKNRIPKVFGYSYMIVETGSMEPTLKVHDFIIVKAKDEYFENDILTFYYDINNDHIKEVVTHRLINIEDDQFTLKGDNDGGTQTINKEDVIGKVTYHSSFIGSILSLNIFRNKNFIFGVLVFGLALFALYQVVNIIKIAKQKEENE